MVVTSRVQYHIDRLLTDAETAFREADFPAARLLINAVLALDPGNQEALRYLEPASGRIVRRRYTRHSTGHSGEPLPTPGLIEERCETVLRRELTGFMSTTQTVWLEAYSIGRDGRKLVYTSKAWKAGKEAFYHYETQVGQLIRELVKEGWRLLPGDPEDMPRFTR
jgi:hypothetical protein